MNVMKQRDRHPADLTIGLFEGLSPGEGMPWSVYALVTILLQGRCALMQA